MYAHPPFLPGASVMVGPREDATARRFNFRPEWIALCLSLFTVFYQVGVTSQRIAENSRRVELLEASDRQRSDAIGRIDARTARIEATLDIVTRGGIGRPLSAPFPNPEPTEPQGATP